MSAAMQIRDCGDSALTVVLGSVIDPQVSRAVHDLARGLGVLRQSQPGLVDVVPAYCSVMVCYDPLLIGRNEVLALVEQAAANVVPQGSAGRLLRIPVCYGGDLGPDLPAVAAHAGLGETQVVELHCGTDYSVQMLGFMPGFSYLAGLDPRIHTPRLEVPRTKIPAGSVGIGGQQTGIYPLDAPGGWQLIGRTPLRVFDPDRSVPVPYEPGDVLRFVPIGREEFQRLAEAESQGAGILWNVGPAVDSAVTALWSAEEVPA